MNRTRVIEASGVRVTWTYDAANRLTREQRSGASAYDRQSTFDAANNRTVWNVDGVRTTSTFDGSNQLLTSTTPSGRSRTTSVWDDQNRRVQVLLPNSQIVTNTYRDDSLRYTKQDSKGTTKFIWDENRYLAETNATNEIQVVYTHPPVPYGQLVSQYRKSDSLWVPSYYHSDILGSTRALTNASAVTTDSYLYDAWGETLAQSGSTTNPFLWIGSLGYYYDSETGTYYVRARIYEPTVGRWLTADPADWIDYENLYAYSSANPVNDFDPSGLWCQIEPAKPNILPPAKPQKGCMWLKDYDPERKGNPGQIPKPPPPNKAWPKDKVKICLAGCVGCNSAPTILHHWDACNSCCDACLKAAGARPPPGDTLGWDACRKACAAAFGGL